MPGYATYDFLPDLTPSEMRAAQPLTLTPVTDASQRAIWENSVIYVTAANYASLSDIFAFTGTLGATYDIISTSFFDPFILEVYDNLGNVIAYDDDTLAYGTDHAKFKAPYSGTFYVNASWHQGSATSNKGAGIAIFEDLDTVPKKNFITGTNGADRILGSGDSDVVTGGDGLDTFVLGRQREHYSLVVNNGTVTVTDLDGLSGSDTLQGIERIQFFDGIVSFETQGIAPQAYRLYQAAFDRTPDAGGLGYWIAQMNKGMSLKSVAGEFVKSAEFTQLYGATPSNNDVLAKVYQNVLHRVPDQAGFDYWIGLLNNKTITTTDMLASFSESTENQAQVIGSLNAGFLFTY
jgi:serralysin